MAKLIKKKIKIAFFSTSRAEFGNMIEIISKLKKNKKFKVYLFLCGMHLHKDFRKIDNEAKKLKIKVTEKISFFNKSDSTKDILNNLNIFDKKLNQIFLKYNFNKCVIFGDRFELLPILNKCVILKKELYHFGGGEKTLGSIDNKTRYILSSGADHVFVSNNIYKQNLLNYFKVFKISEIGTQSIKKFTKKHINEIKKLYNFDLKKKYLILAFHSETISTFKKNMSMLNNILKNLKNLNLNILITAANKEIYSNSINKTLKNFEQINKNVKFIPNLGSTNFNAAVAKAEFIIGNSSAGMIIAPYYKTPSINIGKRQTGRILHESVINSNGSINDIMNSIKKIYSKTFIKLIKNQKFKFSKKNISKIHKFFI